MSNLLKSLNDSYKVLKSFLRLRPQEGEHIVWRNGGWETEPHVCPTPPTPPPAPEQELDRMELEIGEGEDGYEKRRNTRSLPVGVTWGKTSLAIHHGHKQHPIALTVMIQMGSIWIPVKNPWVEFNTGSVDFPDFLRDVGSRKSRVSLVFFKEQK